METTADTLKELKREALSGGLANASAVTLDAYSAALCHSQAYSYFGAHEFPQICETVRIHLLRAHIARLQTHITALDEKNTKLTIWVIVLAAAALISTVIQTVVVIRAEFRAGSQAQFTVSAPQLPRTPAQDANSAQGPSSPPIAPAPKRP